MIPVTPELAAAIEAGEQAVTPVVSVNWDGDGHGPAGGVDDLSAQVEGFVIERVLTDDLPAQVRQVAGSVAAAGSVDLSGRLAEDGSALSAAAWWSPFSTASPLAGKGRIGRDARVGVQYATTAGPQAVQRMAGSTQALAVSLPADTARLDVLDYRDRLRALVALPVWRPPFGTINASAVVSYTLWRAGLPLSPPPRPGCRGWWPMHGTPHGYVVTAWTDGFYGQIYDGAEDLGLGYEPGPFFLAPTVAPPGTYLNVGGYCRPTGPPIRYRNGHVRGRIECWLRLSALPATGNDLQMDVYDRFGQQPTGITLRITPSGALSLRVAGQTETSTTGSPGPVFPADDAWHFLGAHFDTATGRIAFRLDQTTTTTTGSFPIIGYRANTIGRYPIIGYRPDNSGLELVRVLCQPDEGAICELHVTAGIAENEPWLNEVPFTPPAVALDMSQLTLTGLVPPTQPVEAWEILRQLAAAELGSVFLDESGRLHYATRARLLAGNAQTVQRSITSADLLVGLSIEENAGTIANTVAVPYSPITVNHGTVWELGEVLTVPAGGVAEVLVELEGPRGGPNDMLLTVDINTAVDGTGTQLAAAAQVKVSNGYGEASYDKGYLSLAVVENGPTTARLRLSNDGETDVHLVTPDGHPGLRLDAQWLTQQEAPDTPIVISPASVARYGCQSLPLDATPWRQQPDLSAGIGAALLCELRDPQPALVTEIGIVGDPRLQFYDRLRIADTDAGSGLDMQVWVTGVRERFDDAGYVMDLAARPARTQYRIGTGLVGVDLIGG